MAYQKPQVVAQSEAKKYYVAGCPAKTPYINRCSDLNVSCLCGQMDKQLVRKPSLIKWQIRASRLAGKNTNQGVNHGLPQTPGRRPERGQEVLRRRLPAKYPSRKRLPPR